MTCTHPIPKVILNFLLAIGVGACALIGAYPEDPDSPASSPRDTVDVSDDRGGQPSAAAQAPSPSPVGTFWIGAYIGVGFQSEYHDGLVQFADGDMELLTLDPGSGVVFGARAGYRFAPSWTAQANLGYSKSDAQYVEDGTIRPDVGLSTTQIELGVLYDLSTFPVGGELAEFFLGGGLSLTFHSFDRFQWGDFLIAPISQSFGVHGLAGLDIPLTSVISLNTQAKLTVTALSLGDLNDKIAVAEGVAIVQPLDGGIGTYFVLSVGVSIRPG